MSCYLELSLFKRVIMNWDDISTDWSGQVTNLIEPFFDVIYASFYLVLFFLMSIKHTCLACLVALAHKDTSR